MIQEPVICAQNYEICSNHVTRDDHIVASYLINLLGMIPNWKENSHLPRLSLISKTNNPKEFIIDSIDVNQVAFL